MELPDYASDGDSKTGAAAFLGLDSNSVDVNASFAAALHGKCLAQYILLFLWLAGVQYLKGIIAM
jgi:hypothetical protein